MARKRMIDPSFWRDEKMAECSFMERLLFQGLWTFAEDHGVGRASPKLIKADVFPYDTLRESDIQTGLDHLSRLGMIVLYEVEGQNYYFVKNFKKHQTINKPTPSTLPLPDDYGSPTAQEKRREDKEKESIVHFWESVWKLYPEKKGKGQVSDTQKKKLYAVGLDELSRCIERYTKSKPDWQQYQNGSTFFNSGYIDYLDANYSGEATCGEVPAATLTTATGRVIQD